ncbi:MAG: glycosyltransferase [Mobilitalea sp.]
MVFDQKLPKISVITASLNQGRFLRQMIESILSQSFKDFEHIIVDGGSTDNSIQILKEYPHIKWISEKDESPVEGLVKAVTMAKGEYIMQCCVSDGYLYNDWFKTCVDVLDNDPEVSLVWALPQLMSEDGRLGKISSPEFLDSSFLQKKEFLPYWLATGSVMFEGNQCMRRKVFDICFPADWRNCRFGLFVYNEFAYNFNTRGFLPYFMPLIANYGRIHKNSCTEKYISEIIVSEKKYQADIDDYRARLFSGKVKHYFRDSALNILDEISKKKLEWYKRHFYKIKLKMYINYSFYDLMKFILRKLHLFKLRGWLVNW